MAGFGRLGLAIAGFAVFLALWQVVLWLGLVSSRVVAFPSTFIEFIASRPSLAGFGDATLSSVKQFARGFGIAAIAGTALGLVLGWFRRTGAFLEPLLVATNAVPLIAVIPLMIVTLGLGAATETTIIALFAFFPVYFAVSSAVAGVDAELVRMSRSFGGNDWKILAGIVVPFTVPAIITGLRIAVGRALTGLVVVELFIGSGGLGAIILNAVNQGQPNVALLAVVALGAANAAASGALQLIQRKVEVWRPVQAWAQG